MAAEIQGNSTFLRSTILKVPYTQWDQNLLEIALSQMVSVIYANYSCWKVIYLKLATTHIPTVSD